MNTTYFSDNVQSGYPWDFPGGPVVKTPHFQCERCGFDSWSGPSLVDQMVKNLPAVCETRVQSLGREDPLEKEMATYSNILAWRIPWTKEPGGLQSMRLQRVGHVWATNIFTRNYGPTCHRLDRKKKKKRRIQLSGYSWFVIGSPLSGHLEPSLLLLHFALWMHVFQSHCSKLEEGERPQRDFVWKIWGLAGKWHTSL